MQDRALTSFTLFDLYRRSFTDHAQPLNCDLLIIWITFEPPYI